MKPKIQLLAFLIFILFSTSCSDDDTNVEDIYHTWEAKDFASIESRGYPKNEENTISLLLEKSGTYQLHLDVNGCGGEISDISGSQIKFTPATCTEICCDSEFSKKLAQMLPKVTSYSIKENKLTLSVPEWGLIFFELAD